MAEILSDSVVANELWQAGSAEDPSIGADRAPFGALTPEDLELLLYDLYGQSRDDNSDYDHVTLMITGADRGRDVWLTRSEVPVGLVQCKRVTSQFTAPAALREIIKFLLFAELDPALLPDSNDFTYCLALSAEPTGTTVAFFEAPKIWLVEHEAEIARHVELVIKAYASFKSLSASSLLPRMKERLNALTYKLLRPVDIDGMLHKLPSVRSRFFKARLVVGVDDAKAMIEQTIEATFKTADTGSGPAPISLIDQAVDDAERGSRALASWPQHIWGCHIDRPEFTTLKNRIGQELSGSTLVVGGAGAGKSALLAKLYTALDAEGRYVLAIKADTLDPDIIDLDALALDLGMGGPIEDGLLALAALHPVVLLIDQLDAVSEVMDQSSHRMQVLLRLATRLQDAKGADGEPLPIHVIVSSRPFEAKFDARFGQLNATEITLSLPTLAQLESLLAELDIDPTAVPETLRETIRTPFALSLYVDLVKAGAAPDELRPGNLLERWLDKKLPAGPERASFLAFLRRLASDMTEHETLWRPASHYEPEHSTIVRAVVAFGLIARDGLNIGFSHQSWLDDFQAKGFTSGDALATFAKERQDGLFARGTILRGLEYLRKNDRAAYERALHILLMDPQIRRHLRHLVVDFVANATGPSAREIAWIEWLIRNDQPLANRAVGKIALRWSSWRAGLNPLLPSLMQHEGQRWNAVILLIREAGEDAESAMDLIERYWSSVDRDVDVFHVFDRVPLASPRAIARVRLIFKRTRIAEHAVSYYAKALSDAGQNDIAIDLIAFWADTQQESRAHSVKIHYLEKIAAGSPLRYVMTFLPWFVTAATREYGEGRPRSYPRSNALSYDWQHERDQGHIIGVLRGSLATCAREHVTETRELLHAYFGTEIDEVQSVIANTFAENPAAFKDDALAFLLEDTRRLNLGLDTFDDEEGVTHLVQGWSSANLTEKISRYMNAKEVSAFIAYIEGWAAYSPDLEHTETSVDRRNLMRWSEEERLRLLSVLPQEALTARRRRQVAEWQADQPKLGKTPRRMMARFVGSPMTQQQMALADDHDIFRILDEIHDGTDRHHNRRSFRTGGVRELSSAFAEFAKAHPARAIGIIRQRLVPGRHEDAAGNAIRELAGVEGQDLVQLKEVIWELHRRGFASESWHRDSAWAFDSIANKAQGLDEADIALLRSWLVRDAATLTARADINSDQRESNRARNEKPDQTPSAILFGPGSGLRIVPQENFAMLSAIAAGLLSRAEPDCDAWLHELETHVAQPEDPAIWSALLTMRSHHLWWADAPRTSILLDSIWRRFPAAFDDAAVIIPLWRLRKRMDAGLQMELVAYWRAQEDSGLRQIAGEFAAACVILEAENPEMHALVDEIMSTGDVHQKCGVLFSAAAGWRDDDKGIRERSHAILLRAAPTATGFEAHALSTAVDNGDRFQPDEFTRAMLTNIKDNPDLLRASVNMFFMRSLQGLLLYPGFDELVLDLAEGATALALASPEKTIGGLYDGEFVGLAVTLQRSPAGLRERAMTMYEALLDAEVRGAEEAAISALRH